MVLKSITLGTKTAETLEQLASNNKCRQRDIITIAINELSEQPPQTMQNLLSKYYID